ncbi:DUF362 domain-containing protein [Candidatus Woesearchaeota archaeon]|nr:DUF362 domain-containing protein [Candidatus Woesearchaeota archaeon]
MAKVSIIKAGETEKAGRSDAALLEKKIAKAISLIGPVSKFIKKGDSVLIKANYNSDDPPPASSDPEFVRAVIHLLKKAGAKKIGLGDSSGPFWKPTMRVFERTGIRKVAEEEGVELRDFDNEDYYWKDGGPDTKQLRGASIPRALDDYNKLVYVCCMKTHGYARQTLSKKLAMGFPRTKVRLWMHAYGLESKIAELNMLVNPDLIIMDGRLAFTTGGPDKGTLEKPGVILASTDRVAIDIEAIKILQSYNAKNDLVGKPEELPMIKRAIELGIGWPGEVIKQ